LAGFARVGLAAVVERLLGIGLAKEHSAVDWSTRPLPEPWLRYAALDVEVLVELRHALAAELHRQGKSEWARQEFAALAAAPAPPPRVDPWRRTSGMHRVRTRKQLAVVRELWSTRETLAMDQDVSPGRILPDSSIVEASLALPGDGATLVALPTFTGRGARRHLSAWMTAIKTALALGDDELPALHLPAEGPPPPRVWADRDPAAAARLDRTRTSLIAIAEAHHLPVENLLSPDAVRRVMWQPPGSDDAPGVDDVAAALAGYGARPWQIALTVDALTAAITPGDQISPDPTAAPLG
jgi:ribonuclease D